MQDNISAFPSRKAGRPAPAPRQNLPAYLTPLVGREQTVQAGCALLRRAEVRLVTLTGTGGVGKTRLGLQIATELLDDFADGVCFVSLAPISDPDLVIPTIAQALDLKEVAGQSLPDLLHVFLRDKHLLLLLDNFEQVVTAAPKFSDLLVTCPDVKILVTSRAVLHVQGEHEFPVPPLAVPDLKQLPELEALAQYAAVALFRRRAQAIQPAFRLTKNNARAVAEICAHLDGLPLAIELAAARVKLLPPQALLARLAHRLQMLTSGPWDVPERHRTLRNTIQWSYDLLDAAEQQLFRRLSVFVGGCTLEAIEATCAALHEGAGQVLDGVASLLDKSLLLQTEQEEEEPRLVLLETIREYGLEALVERGEAEFTRHAHAEYYLVLAEEAEQELDGPKQAMWLERLEREHDNLRAVMRWSLERGEAGHSMELALRLGGALWLFWLVRGRSTEGRSFLERALAGSQQGVVASALAKALGAAAGLAFNQDDIDRGEALCQESLALYRELGDAAGIATSLYKLGLAAKTGCNFFRARSLIEEAQALWRQLNDRDGVARSLVDLAYIVSTQGDYTRGRALYEESLAIYRGLGNKRGIVVVLREWAEVLLVSQVDPVTVRSLLEESLTLAKELGDKNSIAFCFSLSAQVALSQGDTAGARSLLEESVVLFRETGNRWGMAQALSGLARVEARQGDEAAARALYEEGLAIATAGNFQGHIAPGLEGLASVVATQGERAWAAELWGAAEFLRETIGVPLPPVERASYEQAITSARTQLGEEAFAAAWAKGSTLSPKRVLAARGAAAMPTPPPTGPPSTPPAKPSPTHPAGLTTREVEVLRLVAQGLTDTQVAQRLVISPRTVNWHLTSIYSKLQVSSRSAATRYAIEHTLV